MDKAIGLFTHMESIFKIMLAGATLPTTGTAPRTSAAPIPMGPGDPTHPLLQHTSSREGALNNYKPVCSSHAAHWKTTKSADCTRGCGAVGALQEACRRGMWCGVPSVVAIGPFGGRGVPSGRWALTLTHTMNSNLGTAVEVIDGGVAKESSKKGLGVRRSARKLGGGSDTAAGRPTRGTGLHAPMVPPTLRGE